MSIPEVPDSRLEHLLGLLIGQETAHDTGCPQSRLEEYLKYIIANGTEREQEIAANVLWYAEGYYHNGEFYKDAQYTELITGEDRKFYFDKPTGDIYRWDETDGYVFIISGQGPVTQNDIEFGVAGQTEPSDDLRIGGMFLERRG